MNTTGDHATVVFDDKLWVIGGIPDGNDVWYSCNGINWTAATLSAPFEERYSLAATFNRRMWVIGGLSLNTGNSLNDVWVSPPNGH